MTRKIYTIGYGNRDVKEFIEILKKFEIECIVDVRRFPTSKFEYYTKKNLKKILKKENIEYIWIEDLGGFRGGYKRYMQSSKFKQAIKKLIEISSKRKTCILCAEYFPWRCHRRYIANYLQILGIEVVHLIDANKVWLNKKYY